MEGFGVQDPLDWPERIWVEVKAGARRDLELLEWTWLKKLGAVCVGSVSRSLEASDTCRRRLKEVRG